VKRHGETLALQYLVPRNEFMSRLRDALSAELFSIAIEEERAAGFEGAPSEDPLIQMVRRHLRRRKYTKLTLSYQPE
jgi:hypothetical protein